MIKEENIYDFDDYFQANKQAWDIKTPIHKMSSFYDIDGFLKGKSSLYSIEQRELPKLSGKDVLHLQCHFGLDTISFSRMGANATGVDISDVSIHTARKLNNQCNQSAKFICSNIYNLDDKIRQKFDLVYCSYGSVIWLPDLQLWAKMISSFLKPEGSIYIVDFHPILVSLSYLESSSLEISYFNNPSIPLYRRSRRTYTRLDLPEETIEYTWNHSLSEIINSLLMAGLNIEFFNEFPYIPFDCFPNLIKSDDGNWRVKGKENLFPLCYSISAQI
ncbi:MAG: class I SAM-dependent methyltransferase [Bacteroidota bacterium]